MHTLDFFWQRKNLSAKNKITHFKLECSCTILHFSPPRASCIMVTYKHFVWVTSSMLKVFLKSLINPDRLMEAAKAQSWESFGGHVEAHRERMSWSIRDVSHEYRMGSSWGMQRFSPSLSRAHSLVGGKRQTAHYPSEICVVAKNAKGALGT